MNPHEINIQTAFLNAENQTARGLRVGIDIAQISAIENSFTRFGDHFLRRIFSDGEVAYASSVPDQTAQRLAARFAAKEAAMKAFDLSEAGIGWRDIDVSRAADGVCTLLLHRRAAEVAAQSGCTEMAVSLSHDGDYATAVVVALAPHRSDRSGASHGESATVSSREKQRFSMSAHDEFDAQIRSILAQHGRLADDANAISVHADLYRAGMSSHASVNVMLALESRFDVEFPDEMLKRSVFASIASIREAVAGIGVAQV